MRKFEYKDEHLYFETEIQFFFEKRITKFGSGAKIDAPKAFLGKRVIVLVCK